MLYLNIPEELRNLRQWVLWRYEERGGGKPTKIPYSPVTRRMASTSEPATWGSFEQAVELAGSATAGYDGIGFVFTANDPYCGIDFDYAESLPNFFTELHPQQQAMAEALDSYSELSPSGQGLHVITKASVPNGRKRVHIEVYSTGRFFTMTGNVVAALRIADRQEVVSSIWETMGGSSNAGDATLDAAQTQGDQEVYNVAAAAANGDLFVRLYSGDWSDYPPNAAGDGSSEADLALVDILAYYTQNREQIFRMFMRSGLGQRAKYRNANPVRQSTLVGYMITKSFDQRLPEIDLTALMDSFNTASAVVPNESAAQTPAADGPQASGGDGNEAGANSALPVIAPASPSSKKSKQPAQRLYEGYPLDSWKSRPNGLLGNITQFIYEASPRPVYELSLAAAIGLMAGICGRGYNVSGTGLNHYIIALAVTGNGKEAMKSGIDRLMNAVSQNHLAAIDVLGPAEISSGQALLKHMSDTKPPCFLSLIGEIGLRFQQMSGQNANSSELALQRVLLDLWTKSGAGQTVKPTIYSDKSKNTEDIHSPAFSMLGESVPDTFYAAFDESSVSSGLIPRFTIIEYEGNRPEHNEDAHEIRPTESLVNSVSNLIGFIAKMQSGVETGGVSQVLNVQADDEAREMFRNINRFADWKINSSSNDALRHLWNRIHLKSMKLAALYAIGENPFQPLINATHVEWAFSLLLTDCLRLISRLEFGNNEGIAKLPPQEEVLRRKIRTYLTSDFAHIPNNKLLNPELHSLGVFPMFWLQQACAGLKEFKTDRRGAAKAVNETMTNLVSLGLLVRVNGPEFQTKYGKWGNFFSVYNKVWILAD